ncbi:MAG: methylated-DNA--[protein]-cysteine S-methyltransferase [Rhodospirillaceae bacterium]|nr:methylated-DNA--[protein]-cysteine S-methyltransferase [Rhodospirillaceae bacterium]
MPQLSFHSPIGDITVSEEDGAIVSVDWGWARDNAPTPLLRRAQRQFDAYFDGTLTVFDLPLSPVGTPFQQKVWRALGRIPYGRTTSYGALAARLGSAARAVGAACGANPIPIIIPCHRVVGANGHLCGYSGEGGLATKAALMRLEGIETQAELRV